MAGDGGLFRMKFRLVGFDTEKEDEYRSLIRKGGGTIDLKYEWRGLTLITSNDTVRYADQICVEARNNGAVVLNEFWLEDTLASRAIADTRNVLYQPPLSLDGVKGAGHLLIAQSGFSPKESGDIKRLIELIGASEAKEDEVSKISYLICCKPEGEDYRTARAKDVFTVNKKWIEACVIEWDIVSVDHYISWPQDQETAKGQASGSQKTPSKMEIDMNIGRKGYCTERKVKTEPRESRKRSAEPKNTCKRQTLWTAPSCRKSLFNQRSLSDSKRSDLIVKVQIPRSRLEIDVGTDDIKRFLLASYASLVNIIIEGECIKNQFDSNCFQMLLGSDQVKIELVQLVPFTEELATSNKKQFVLMVQKLYRDNGCRVPDDIAGWLSSIAARVPDRVLKQHVNMLGRTEIFGTFVSIYYAVLGLKRNDSVSYNQVINLKELSIYIDWEKIPFSWIVFHDCLTYIHPRQLEVYRLRCQQNSGQLICQPKPKKRDSNVFGLLELIRDCFFHPALDYQSMLLPVLLIDYPGLLADLQQLLSALGHLK